MKTLLHSPLTKLTLALGIAAIGFTGCQKEAIVMEQPQQGVQQQNPNPEAQLRQERMLAEALKGGLEISTGNYDKGSSQTRALNNRVLINGSIIGHNVSGYQAAYVSAAGNLMVHAAELLRRYEYTVSFASGVLTATRNSTNTFGARSIRLTNGSTTVSYTTSGGINTSTTLPQAPVIQNGVLMCPARILAILAGAAILEWDADTNSLQTYYYELNDFGIYFYGTQQNAIRTDAPGCQKYIPGEPNAFFDPNKPTIIYAHGWQKGSVDSRGRESFLFTLDNEWQNVQNYWRNAGWNVGIFHWVQIADDDWGAMPVDTEKKIYDANSPVGMRWKQSNGTFSTRGNPTLNVTQLYRQEYQRVVSALASSAEIRLIGNSLGGNLTMAMLREVAINNTHRLPSRVTLMDPYWDPSLDASDGITLPAGLTNTRAVGTNAAQRLNNAGVAIEYFRTSIAGATGYNKGVADIAAYVNFVPGYTGDQAAKHTQPVRQYMWALAFNPPTTGPSPRTTNAAVRNMMSTQNYWDHTAGTNTATPSDDNYTVRSGKPN